MLKDKRILVSFIDLTDCSQKPSFVYVNALTNEEVVQSVAMGPQATYDAGPGGVVGLFVQVVQILSFVSLWDSFLSAIPKLPDKLI